MVRVSNGLLGFLNILTLVISFPVVGSGVWFQIHGASACERALQWPVMALGLFLLAVSLMGLLGSCCRVSFLLWVYLFVLFILILAMFCFAVFAFVVTNHGAGEAVSGKGYKEYRLGDYSHWLQRRVADWNTWKQIESCIGDAKLCGGLDGEVGSKANEFYKQNLSPIQSGCCKPPTYCGFVYKNATFWVAPKSGLNTRDADCKAWSNDQDKLCYGCNSCKAGVLATIKNKWKVVSIFNVALLVLLIIVYSIGCCAIRNNRADSHYKRYYGYR
ncbi:tetraspanin-8-like [Ananas comosus]|uniref:Tetraspanin-8 n=1 Tax=Ananas comosus TaxID=4615 RepID=A0A199UMA7_ANACO|nr:tetraspanin-8-like [Ananas comosus]OAY65816.1 Tetraspanin-8 [Ananas comosus]